MSRVYNRMAYRELSRAGTNVYITGPRPSWWTYHTVLCVSAEVWDACPTIEDFQ